MGIDLSETIEAECNDTENTSNEAPTFGDEMSSKELQEACREYAEWAVEAYDTFDEAELETVTVQVSKRLKRAAGKAGKSQNAPTQFFMRFAWKAYQKWGWGRQFEETIRHELIHIKQYQQTGSGGHGPDFRLMADEVDAPRHCSQFHVHKYGIFCSECDDMVTGRFQECKMTRNPEKTSKISKCCGADLYSKEL